jgi:hypothetical protein
MTSFLESTYTVATSARRAAAIVDLTRTRYVTEHYHHLQGLRLVPVGVAFLAFGTAQIVGLLPRDANPTIVGIAIAGAAIVALGSSHLIGPYYRQHFRSVRPRAVRQSVTWLMFVLGPRIPDICAAGGVSVRGTPSGGAAGQLVDSDSVRSQPGAVSMGRQAGRGARACGRSALRALSCQYSAARSACGVAARDVCACGVARSVGVVVRRICSDAFCVRLSATSQREADLATDGRDALRAGFRLRCARKECA